MKQQEKSQLQEIAHVIRGLSMDAIEAAGCGHPGLPLGCAELGAYLYGKQLKHNPNNPDWINRDRFILSAGHGSMLLYSCLHIAGFNLTIDDLKNFRQYKSKTPGHPEYEETPGVETTTGPLGQGIATGIGIALGQKCAQAAYKNTELLNNKTYILAGDGCFMEGISSEACSFAGHLKLDNIVLIYDSNDICLDGPTHECISEDTSQRYKSYGWDVQTIDGHDFDEIEKAFTHTDSVKGKPCLIIAKTKIGKGSPSLEGSSEVHGKAMGQEEVNKTKEALNIPTDTLFNVPDTVKVFFQNRGIEQSKLEEEWQLSYNKWASQHPKLSNLWQKRKNKELPSNLSELLRSIEIKEGVASRVSSHTILQTLHETIPFLYGGSADLSCSDSTYMKNSGIVGATSLENRNIKYGVREFAMAAIASGLYLQGMFVPFIGTFLTFSDYMKNAIRLAALMKLKVIYQFTHDSILLGEDGPTHQPVEHLAGLRAMPGLTVIRPCDNNETKGAWKAALETEGPVALILSRQGLPSLETTSLDEVSKGAYVIKQESEIGNIDYAILATGSEVSLSLEVADELEKDGQSVRVISIPSFELFNKQSKNYQDSILGTDVKKYVSIEAQSSFGWHQYIGKDGIAISVDTFGLSAPKKNLEDHYGFTKEQILKRLPIPVKQ